MAQFFKEYFEVMGSHFETLGEKEDQEKARAAQQPAAPDLLPEDEQHLRRVMEDPDGA